MVFRFFTNWRNRMRVIQEFREPQEADKEYPWMAEEGVKAARVKLGEGNIEAALIQWEMVRKRFPHEKSAYADPVVELLRLRRLDEAERLILEGAARFPDEVRFPSDLAQVAGLRGDTELALRRLGEVREKFPAVMVGYTHAAQTLHKIGRLDEAEAMLTQGLERFPRALSLLIMQAGLLQTRGQWEEALAQLQALRAEFSPRLDVMRGIANCLNHLGRADEYEAVLGEIRELFPTSLPPLLDHARCAEQRRDWAEALQRYEWIRDRFPNDARGYLGCARSLRQQGRLDEADRSLEDAMLRLMGHAAPGAGNAQVTPQQSKVPVVLQTALLAEHARVAHQRKDWAEASRRWARLSQSAPDNAEAQRRGAEALNALNSDESAGKAA